MQAQRNIEYIMYSMCCKFDTIRNIFTHTMVDLKYAVSAIGSIVFVKYCSI